ncbi:N-acetylmannosamine-6-phosphate 2-epimerase [Lapillicoccus jejuensis]|uniref:Putative N-acetylmannosamine-6-phosphate 2-epimerase n=1 Tax=Lapillicoccus jejuensis TaxID=402171 RepID=A0A542E013_9MICO|nr:N-acetylmannosamine-6-phosphate 2-epimerase [Lapillicoccus jejuensis]TQJ08646.1 N-acylglucosamine-6-phosphate 2-epimerase [Lapillicoccus jejuensis]
MSRGRAGSVLDALRGGLVVSCQAYPGEPMRDPRTMAQVAVAVVAGGASAVRAQGVEDVRLVRASVDVPVVGIWKEGSDGIVITPTLEHARAVRDAGADVVALDGTRRPRPDGLTLAQTVAALRADGEVIVMADCGSLDDARAAVDAGVDLVGTTLAGYTGERPRTDGPDLALVRDLLAALPGVPVVAEGRIHTPAQARACLTAGAFAVCVGTAITHPTTITGWFRDGLA